MPNRILKESICTSESIDGLSLQAELLFYRLLVNCDDYGLLDGRPTVLRSRCFPLRVDRIKDADIVAWLVELEQAGIVKGYSVDGHPYLYMVSWNRHQQIRAQKAKFPKPEEGEERLISADINGNQRISDSRTCPRNPIRIQSESESEHGAARAARTPKETTPTRRKETTPQTIPRPGEATPYSAMFAALVNACRQDKSRITADAGKEIGRAANQLLEAGYSPGDVDEMAKNYAGHFGDCARTPSSYAKHAGLLINPKARERENGTSGQADPDLAQSKYAALSQPTV